MRNVLATVGVLLLIVSFGISFLVAQAQQASGIQVEEAKLCKNVQDRQIVDEATDFSLNDKVYLWLKVTGGSGETLRATWKSGDHTWTSDMSVGGSPWRTWCYKTAALAGDWSVSVADSKGNILKEMTFKVN
jgi:hypothetical protein